MEFNPDAQKLEELRICIDNASKEELLAYLKSLKEKEFTILYLQGYTESKIGKVRDK